MLATVMSQQVLETSRHRFLLGEPHEEHVFFYFIITFTIIRVQCLSRKALERQTMKSKWGIVGRQELCHTGSSKESRKGACKRASTPSDAGVRRRESCGEGWAETLLLELRLVGQWSRAQASLGDFI